MTLVISDTDVDNLTMTLTAEFAADIDRVWQVWEDPRQLERWWGPPTWPATFATLEFSPGGSAHYYMTGPDGSAAHGWWKVIAVDAPNRFEFNDGFADDAGTPVDTEDYTTCVVTFEPLDTGTRMTSVWSFRSAEQLEEMNKMGMEEGTKEAFEQIDAVLAESSISR